MNGGISLVRTHQGRELAEHLTAPDLHGADLGDVTRRRRAAGGLQVDDDERELPQLAHRTLGGRDRIVEQQLEGSRRTRGRQRGARVRHGRTVGATTDKTG